jgi:hypothetical protein
MAPMARNFAEPFDDRIDCRSGDPEPEQPEDGLHDDDGCRDNSNRWRVTQPAEGMCDAGRQSQNGTIHKRMRNTPTRRRNGDGPADFVSSVIDDPSRM